MNLTVQVLREASHVERMHTIPHHGSYSVGQHSFDMAMMLLALHPKPSAELLQACLLGQLHERYTGNVPTRMKQADGEIGKRFTVIERRAQEKIGTFVKLSEAEQHWLRALDVAEAYLWCKDQVAMGNHHVLQHLKELCEWLLAHEANVPKPLLDYMNSHAWVRTSDNFPL